MSSRKTSRGTTSAISLLESADGPTLFDSLDGRSAARQSGQAVVPVSPSVLRENAPESQTRATSGRSSPVSSASAGLQRSLESRLRAALDVNGSPEYSLTWKEWAISGQEPICALRASRHPTSGNGSTGWRTPSLPSNRGIPLRVHSRTRLTLEYQSSLAGWPSPNTPSGGPNSKRKERKAGGPDLEEMVALAGWPTPNTMQGGKTSRGGNRKDEPLLGGIRGFLAPTESPAACLNPAFSRWLMGFPDQWDRTAPGSREWNFWQRRLTVSAGLKDSEMQSLHHSLLPSSKP